MSKYKDEDVQRLIDALVDSPTSEEFSSTVQAYAYCCVFCGSAIYRSEPHASDCVVALAKEMQNVQC